MNKTRIAISILLTTFVLAIPLGAEAGWYVSGAVGYNVHSYANVSNTIGIVAGGGWREDRPNTVGVDISYINAGSASVGGSSNSLTMSGIDLSVLYMLVADPTAAMYLKLGGYNMNTSFVGSGSSSGASLGIGFEFSQNRNLAWYTDMDLLFNVDVPGGPPADNPFIWTFGARYHFEPR